MDTLHGAVTLAAHALVGENYESVGKFEGGLAPVDRPFPIDIDLASLLR